MTDQEWVAVDWVVRQTGHGQRSWGQYPSKVHLVSEGRTKCGRDVPRRKHPSPAMSRALYRSECCSICFASTTRGR